MTKADILNALINHYCGGNKSQFAKKLGISAQGLSTWISRNTFDIETIYSNCENISADWLITGEGDMLKEWPDQQCNRGADGGPLEPGCHLYAGSDSRG